MNIQQKQNILGRKPVKCNAKNPQTCRFHGKKVIEQEILIRRYVNEQKRLQKETAEAAELQIKINVDLEKNLKLRTLKDGTVVCSVYRSGVPSPPASRKVEASSYLETDKYVPAGRQGRTTAVFASPTLGGAGRWVQGNLFIRSKDLKVRELTIDIDNVYVYSVEAWERSSSRMDRDTTVHGKYWGTGITMREWLEKVKQEPLKYDPREWELLIPESEIKSVKPVSGQRTAAYNYSKYESDRKEILQALK